MKISGDASGFLDVPFWFGSFSAIFEPIKFQKIDADRSSQFTYCVKNSLSWNLKFSSLPMCDEIDERREIVVSCTDLRRMNRNKSLNFYIISSLDVSLMSLCMTSQTPSWFIKRREKSNLWMQGIFFGGKRCFKALCVWSSMWFQFATKWHTFIRGNFVNFKVIHRGTDKELYSPWDDEIKSFISSELSEISEITELNFLSVAWNSKLNY